MASQLSDITNNPEALTDFNSLPRNERIKVINRIDPSFKEMKLKDRFDVLDHLEGHTPKPTTLLGQAGRVVTNIPKGLGKAEDVIRGGLAGTGVMAEKMATTPGSFKERVQQALLSAAPAVKPGYKPQEGEKIGYYAGKYSPELLGLGKLGVEAVSAGAEKLSAPTVKQAYQSLEEVLTKHGVEPGTSEITENTPEAIAEYAKNTKKILGGAEKPPFQAAFRYEDGSIQPTDAHGTWKIKTPGKESGFIDSKGNFHTVQDLQGLIEKGQLPEKPFTALKDDPSKLERIREDVTRIFNNEWESPKTQVGRDLAKAKDAATEHLISKVPEIGTALKNVKSAYDKEELIDSIMKAAKVIGTGAAFETGRFLIGNKLTKGLANIGNLTQ